MAKIKIDGHIWDLVFNQYGHNSFCNNQTNFPWDIANQIFTL